MRRSIHLSLKAGERVFVNGAVLRVDRKVSVELLNDATFLLEQHMLQVEQATTPLRQLYFVAQAILIDPVNSERTRAVFRDLHAATLNVFTHEAILAGLRSAGKLVGAGMTFEALKIIRGLFEVESAVVVNPKKASPMQAAPGGLVAG